MTIHIERLGHIVLRVRDLERSVSFFRDILGLREVGHYRGCMVFFSATGENHHDLAVLEIGPDARQPDDHTVGLCHLALKIGDRLDELRAAKAHLESNGVRIRRIENHWVSRSIYFTDPDGNEIELYVDDDPRIWKENPSAVATVEPFEI